MKTIYSIYSSARCITESYDKADVIAKATEYFQDQREEDGFIGTWEEEITLISVDVATDKETTETITLTGEAEEYEGPRA